MSSSKPFPFTIIMGVIIIIVVIMTSLIQSPAPKPFSQIITVGPVWGESDGWSCTSDADYVVYGALRGLEGAQITIEISDLGSQSLYTLEAGKMETFTVGSPAGHTMTITRTGAVTGWITLQTTFGVIASCTQT